MHWDADDIIVYVDGRQMDLEDAFEYLSERTARLEIATAIIFTGFIIWLSAITASIFASR